MMEKRKIESMFVGTRPVMIHESEFDGPESAGEAPGSKEAPEKEETLAESAGKCGIRLEGRADEMQKIIDGANMLYKQDMLTNGECRKVAARFCAKYGDVLEIKDAGETGDLMAEVPGAENIRFKFEELGSDIRKYAEKNDLTLGGEADRMQEILDCVNFLYAYGMLTKGDRDRTGLRFRAKLKAVSEYEECFICFDESEELREMYDKFLMHLGGDLPIEGGKKI